jgi:hypothetical protein
MPELHLAREYDLPYYDGLKLRQESPAEAAEVLLNLLDNRYVTSLLQNTARIVLEGWRSDGIERARYGAILDRIPAEIRDQLAFVHAVFSTGEQSPDPEDVPASDTASLLEDWDLLDSDAQENVLLNAVHTEFQLRIHTGQHPYAVIYNAMEAMNPVSQGETVSLIMKQYVRQFHASRQNRN